VALDRRIAGVVGPVAEGRGDVLPLRGDPVADRGTEAVPVSDPVGVGDKIKDEVIVE
jgi:hypothetical protein